MWALVEALLGCYVIEEEEEAWRDSEATGCFEARIIFPLTVLPTWASACGPSWAVCTGLLELPPGAASWGCLLGLPPGSVAARLEMCQLDSPGSEEVQPRSRRLVFSSPSMVSSINWFVLPNGRKSSLSFHTWASLTQALSQESWLSLKVVSRTFHLFFPGTVMRSRPVSMKQLVRISGSMRCLSGLRAVVVSYFAPLQFRYSLRTLTFLPKTFSQKKTLSWENFLKSKC